MPVDVIGRCELCGVVDHHLVDGQCAGCMRRFQANAPVQVIACRPADRAMLATPAGQQLVLAAARALGGYYR